MEELEVPSEYVLAITQIHDKFIGCARSGDDILDFFNNTIGVKQARCTLSSFRTPIVSKADDSEQCVHLAFLTLS